MRRIPEPELMDDPEQARAYAEADFSEPHNLFVELFREAFPGEELAGTALDLGCGPADATIRLARAYPLCRIDGLDGAAAMLRLGREAVRQAGLESRVRLIQGYLPGAAAPLEAYDAVVSNSLLHHLGDPATLWASVRRWGRPGARVLVMDLLRPETPAEAAALVRRHAADAPEVLRRDFENSLRAAYRPEEVRGQLAAAGLGDFAVRAVSDRHLAVAGRLAT
jgi:SAM-dependent methyltransferase